MRFQQGGYKATFGISHYKRIKQRALKKAVPWLPFAEHILFPLVGFKGNLALLEISLFPEGMEPMEAASLGGDRSGASRSVPSTSTLPTRSRREGCFHGTGAQATAKS